VTKGERLGRSRKPRLSVAAPLLLSVLLVFAPACRSSRSPATQAENPLAPDFTLQDLTGHPLTLSSYRGKVVLLDFWATWCGPCREEVPRFVEMQNRYGGRDLQILGVSMDDSPEPVREFQQNFKMNYPVVMGTAKTGELYGGVLGLPIAFVIDQQGRIRAKHIGATPISTFEREITKLLPDGATPH
jgi:cytochrome c biogenesis protein CcmG, thiol:disulfide interchange protein DsbE